LNSPELAHHPGFHYHNEVCMTAVRELESPANRAKEGESGKKHLSAHRQSFPSAHREVLLPPGEAPKKQNKRRRRE